MLDVRLRQQRGAFTLDAAFSAPTPGVVALFGRSGCGKTTLLNLIAGLLPAQDGRIDLDGDTWLDTASGLILAVEQRRAGYVFQDARLFPHYSVRGNLLYGARRSNAGIDRRTFDTLVELLGLEALLNRRPRGLSGGERQRVALARALLANPRILLLDEPLSSLDAARRDDVLPYLERLRDHFSIPMVFVSHQFDDVLRLATHVVVMDSGRVVTQGDISQVSLAPELRAIVGRDAIGAVVEATVIREAGADELTELAVGSGRLRVVCPEARLGARLRVQLLARDIIIATARPEHLSVRNSIQGTIASIAEDEDSDLITLDVGGVQIVSRITRSATTALGLVRGQQVWALVKAVSIRGHAVSAPA